MIGEVVAVLIVVLVLAVVGAAWWQATLVRRERQRIAAETLLAEWHLRSIARQATQRMLDEARRSQ